MKLIIGGAYQGKLAYAKKQYHVTEGWLDGQTCGMSEILSCRGIYHFHEYVRRMMQADLNGQDMEENIFEMRIQTGSLSSLEQQAENFAGLLERENPNILIVSNELGYGVVPMEKSDRLWREVTGRICTSLAKRADEVVRVVCGVGQHLK